MLCQFLPFFSLKQIFYMALKPMATFLKSMRFYRHQYYAIVIKMAEMANMAKMAIINILDKWQLWL